MGQPHVVIVGAGFGGLYAARALKRADVRVTLLDRRNHHLFQPLLYQVATAAVEPSSIAVPIRGVLRNQRNATVQLAEAEHIDLDRKEVRLADGVIRYDFLILATGVSHSYFGREEWRPHAPGLKSVEDALEVRRRIFLSYEAAERETDPGCRQEWMTFVIVGGGPTGVELAGALGEISRSALTDGFRGLDPKEARVLLLEGLARVLPTYPQHLSEKAEAHLERLGVTVRTGTLVTSVDGRGVWLGPERVWARTVIWAAGVLASSLARTLGTPCDRAGRLLVEADLTLPGHEEVFAIGDIAAFEEHPVPGVAPAAIQEGRHAARNIERALRGEPHLPFRYFDKGSFAVIGRGAAVAHVFGRVPLWGPLAWLSWLTIHLYFLIGFRNRLIVLLNWAFSYFTHRRGARLITGERPRRLAGDCGETTP